MSTNTKTGCIAGLLNFFTTYSYTLDHRKGAIIGSDDMPSRLHQPSTEEDPTRHSYNSVSHDAGMY